MFAAQTIALLLVDPPKLTEKGIDNAIIPSAVDLRSRHLDGDPKDKSKWEFSEALAYNILIAKNLERFSYDTFSQDTLMDDVWILAKETCGQVQGQRPYMDRAGYWVHELMMTILMNVMGDFMKQQGYVNIAIICQEYGYSIFT
jgi:hypothetical protein